jgi:Tol biopolymer transport system component
VPAGPAELAFVGPNGVLSISGADGAQPRNLTTIYAGPVLSPTWSPDGRRLAFARCAGPRCSVYLIAADGTGERSLTAGSSPAWSPDGRTLAYAGEDGWIRLVSVASGRSRPLPGPRAGPGNGLAWSPDGRWLLYDGGFYRPTPKHDDLRNRLLLVRAAGGRARVVSRGPGFYLTSNAAWSPDSKSIAYSRRDRVGSSIASAVAFVVPLDGSAAPRPLGGGAYRPPRFTADGAAVAFNLGLGCRLRLVSLGSGTAQTLPFEACEPAWRP